MKTLLIDNYDSYTYNLYQILTRFSDVTVLKNDDEKLNGMDFGRFDAVVVSPGPGNPENSDDFGYASAAYRYHDVPVLGVCLGHQGLAAAAGGDVISAPAPQHGFVDSMVHFNDPMFAGVPSPFPAVRYHSLAVGEPVPDDMEVIARSKEDGVVMGLKHRRRPHWGLQFHPESIATTHGEQMIVNFLNLALDWRLMKSDPEADDSRGQQVLFGHVRKLSGGVDPLMLARYFDENYRQWVWLDCALPEGDRARYSFFVPAGSVDNDIVVYESTNDDMVTVHTEDGSTQRIEEDILVYLEKRVADTKVSNTDAIPGPLKGGYVGFLGYEMKARCGLNSVHHSDMPDAVWVRCHNYVVVDHLLDEVYIVEITRSASETSWLDEIESGLRNYGGTYAIDNVVDWERPPDDVVEPLARTRLDYIDQLRKIDHELHEGNTYEVCMTNTVRIKNTTGSLPGLDAYLRLRFSNPAPYAAFIKFDDFTVHCSSPECFLTVGADGIVRSRPIKGTASRDEDEVVDRRRRDSLGADRKTLAENLMIVDLVRNDLGRVCVPGSVSVPDYMVVESYETVHQLVSTIRGTLAHGCDVVDAIRASFPPGSMTGAPKLRTTDIIDSLENDARGVYSGSIGYLSYDGAADLNVVIRTAVAFRDEIRIGSGGAIVLDSDPSDEYEEMLLKAKALVRVFYGFGDAREEA